MTMIRLSGIDRERLDWMRHSLFLSEQYLHSAKKPDNGYWATPKLIHRLQREVDALKRVLSAIISQSTYTLDPYHQIWARWMEQHANAQIARYANTMTEEDFQSYCKQIRNARDEALQL
jgi:hypothetical protein